MKKKGQIKQKLLLPKHNERCAYAQPGTSKRAALLFDRISTRDENVPNDILFFIPDAHHHFKAVSKIFINKFRDSADLDRKYNEDEVVDLLIEFDARLSVDSFLRCGYIVTPVYNHQVKFFLDYPKGSTIAYQAALQNLPTIIEEEASWDQIVEFRKDKMALTNYRKMISWLNNYLQAESISQAEDIILKRIEDYEWALRKHGLKTATGALSSILDWKGISALASGAGIAGIIGGPIWSAITGGIVLSAKISIWIAEHMIDREEIKRGKGSEIAVICDAKRILARRKKKLTTL
ncbi:MAG: hypothetical protein KAV44_03815 [Bacteroidales bacterium]|nr:hypothetical protein [Bacteroidales bacterium]